MHRNYNIFYIGLDPNTPEILVTEKKLRITGVVKIDELVKFNLNLVDCLFSFSYSILSTNIESILGRSLFNVWYSVKFLSNATAKRYANYLKLIVDERVVICDSDDDALCALIRNSSTDLIVINGWSILSDKVISAAKKGAINIHPSELPKYRGALPTLWSLKNRDTYSAVTYMIPNSKMDQGSIVSQHRFQISPADNSIDLEHKISKIVSETLTIEILRFLNNETHPDFQPSNIEPSLTAKYHDYLEIKWEEENSREILNKVSLYPFLEPYLYCYFKFNGRKYFIKRLRHSNLEISEVKNKTFSFRGLSVYFRTNTGLVQSILFLDINFLDSIMFIYNIFQKYK